MAADCGIEFMRSWAKRRLAVSSIAWLDVMEVCAALQDVAVENEILLRQNDNGISVGSRIARETLKIVVTLDPPSSPCSNSKIKTFVVHSPRPVCAIKIQLSR